MPVAFDRTPRYFGIALSENIAERPEGYLICRNVPIARTGFQKYKVAELADPDGILGDRSPSEEIEVWRDPSEVFSPATIASFEGVSITLRHPDDLLDPDSEQRHAIGHIENVHKGAEPLESGDWPLLADLIVKAREGIRAVKSGIREVSCGYTYKFAREGYRYEQREIRGNHLAIVPKGRAGEEARINDAAPREEIFDMSIFERLFKKGFSFAKDAKPEDIAAVSRAIALDEHREEPGDAGNPTLKGKKLVAIGKTDDGVEIFKLVGMDDDMEAENKAAMDKKKRLHDTLDRRMTDAEKEEKERSEQEDADLAELKELLGEKKETKEESDDADTHPEGCRCEDCKDSAKDEEIVRPEPTLPNEDVPKNAFDSGTLEVLRVLRPFVARVNDKRLNKAFGVAYDGIKAKVKEGGKGTGTYSQVQAAASRAKDEAAEQDKPSPAQTQAANFDKTMSDVMTNSRKANLERRRAR